MKINKRLLELSNLYDENVFDSTQSWKKLIIDRNKLLGLPEYDLEIAHLESKRSNINGWLLTLKWFFYLSVMKYSEDCVLREEIYWAYNTRAFEERPHAGRCDNTSIIQEILSLRYKLANVLGFNNYADQVLVNRMGKSSDEVLHFLEELSISIYFRAISGLVQLKQFINKYYGTC